MPKHLEELPDSVDELIALLESLEDENRRLYRMVPYITKSVLYKNPYSAVVYGVEVDFFFDDTEEDWTVEKEGQILKHWWSYSDKAFKHWIRLCLSP
jgi:hypothetical protein